MITALVIGIYGFAGSQLREELLNTGYDVYGVDIFSNDSNVYKADITDYNACLKVIGEVKPDIIFNLAGQASPQISWKDINLTMNLNVNLSINICNAVREINPKCRIVFVGSANQYDLSTFSGEKISESVSLNDDSPYAISKNTQEALIKLLIKKYDLDVVMTRSFNHIGPNQKEGFVVTDYCSRIAKLERGDIDTFEYGNLDSWRDFSDVKDVARAYRLIGEKGKSSEIYNVGSGKSYYIRDMIGFLVGLSEKATSRTTLPERLEDDALPHIMADITKLQSDTGFLPNEDIYDTLRRTLERYREIYD